MEVVQQQLMYILFDGECAMCNSFVIFLDKLFAKTNNQVYVTNNPILFWQNIGQDIELEIISEASKETIIVYVKNQLQFRSKAIVSIFKESSPLAMRMLGYLIEPIPVVMCDSIYKIIARFRRKFPIGKKTCSIYSFKNIICL